jgi:uncharacterized DUF497 family protein
MKGCEVIFAIEFEWDENKRKLNIEKHKIDFADAIIIFEDIVYTMPDDRKDYGERRFVSIGLMYGVEITVVYAVRPGIFRIISARRAHSKERRKYHEARTRMQNGL